MHKSGVADKHNFIRIYIIMVVNYWKNPKIKQFQSVIFNYSRGMANGFFLGFKVNKLKYITHIFLTITILTTLDDFWPQY